MGGNEGDDGPRNEADRLLDFFPGAQTVRADDIDLRFAFFASQRSIISASFAPGAPPRSRGAVIAWRVAGRGPG